MEDILLTILIMGVLGALIGIFLIVAGKKFAVHEDEKVLKIREALPGNNCGGCGFAGCDALAKAIAAGEAPVNACPVGGAKVAKEVGAILGVSAGESVRKIAFVKCSGDCEKSPKTYQYVGEASCTLVNNMPGGGDKACTYGCLGYGSCVKVCEYDAIHIVDGIAVIDEDKCVACGMCAKACPRHLIEIIPATADIRVACNSLDKGIDVKKVCSTGCIGCSMCERICPVDAIKVENNLAKIDYDVCAGCAACARKCPSKIIKVKD